MFVLQLHHKVVKEFCHCYLGTTSTVSKSRDTRVLSDDCENLQSILVRANKNCSQVPDINFFCKYNDRKGNTNEYFGTYEAFSGSFSTQRRASHN